MKQRTGYLARYLAKYPAKHFIMWFMLSTAVIPVAHCSSTSSTDAAHAQAWELLYSQLIETPAANAHTSWQAWLNRGITAILWSLCLSNGLSTYFKDPSKINGTEKFRGLVDDDYIDDIIARRKQAYMDLEQTKRMGLCFGACALFSTIWTTYRNRYALVHTAEQEAFTDFLTDFEINKQYLPPDPKLITLFEKASRMAKHAPRKFKKHAAKLLKQIRQRIQSHVTETVSGENDVSGGVEDVDHNKKIDAREPEEVLRSLRRVE